MARHMRLSGLSASLPLSSRSVGGGLGKRAMHGMARFLASRARSARLSTDQRETPGKVAMGSSTPRPSVTKSGQMRSDALRTVAATSDRDHWVARDRRRRTAGKEARVMSDAAVARPLSGAKGLVE